MADQPIVNPHQDATVVVTTWELHAKAKLKINHISQLANLFSFMQ